MQTWQEQLQNALKTPADLLAYRGLSAYTNEIGEQAHQHFMTKVPLSFANRMAYGDIHDPLLRQVLPLREEEHIVPTFTTDPLDESSYNVVPGLLHKYKTRVLVTLSGHCAINCRYCFRRHFDYDSNNVGQKAWGAIFDYIQRDSAIHEVILSGGDPLSVPDRVLDNFVKQLYEIPHVDTLRFHTRLPIVLPDRISDDFIAWVQRQTLKIVMVVHSNHPQEINDEVRAKMSALHAAGVVLLNQSVLLKGINDDAKVLAALSRALFQAHVLPYYLHQLDKVSGTHHFEVSDETALTIYQALQASVSGYLVPKLVREVAGDANKRLI